MIYLCQMSIADILLGVTHDGSIKETWNHNTTLRNNRSRLVRNDAIWLHSRTRWIRRYSSEYIICHLLTNHRNLLPHYSLNWSLDSESLRDHLVG